MPARCPRNKRLSQRNAKQKDNVIGSEGTGIVMSCMENVMGAERKAVDPLLAFDPQKLYKRHLKCKYGRFHHDQLHYIQSFRCEKDDSPCTMYT